eukprot:5106812-Amphidinium_carterae.1
MSRGALLGEDDHGQEGSSAKPEESAAADTRHSAKKASLRTSLKALCRPSRRRDPALQQQHASADEDIADMDPECLKLEDASQTPLVVVPPIVLPTPQPSPPHKQSSSATMKQPTFSFERLGIFSVGSEPQAVDTLSEAATTARSAAGLSSDVQYIHIPSGSMSGFQTLVQGVTAEVRRDV